ncbi:MAG: metallophosphatase [Prevotella sp.]|nr:metallophosphatase [Prevotella sp.]
MKRLMMMAAACLAVMAVAAQKQLTILHTNDTHSTVMPLSDNLNDTMKAGRGGFLRRVAMVEAERRADPDLLLFDSGDFSQGSTYYTMYKGDVEIGLMNMMKYDAATIGNHEFDFGLENMVRLFRMAEFPVVCANYDFRGTIAEDVVKPYVVLRRSGLRIGVFGLSPKLGGLVSWKNYPGVKYLDPVKTAAEMVAVLKGKERCDVVVCLSHLGWDMKPEVDDSTVIANTEGIDIVLGGHSHTYLKDLEWVTDKGGRRVPVDQNGKHGIFIGKMRLKVDKVK